MKICQNCRSRYEKSRYDIYCSKECWEAKYWEKILESKPYIINGHAYKSYGGTGFDKVKPRTIKTNSGKVVEVKELWDCGQIPRKYHKSDNAKFI